VAGTPTATGTACTECGAQLPASAKFCPECGTSVVRGPSLETRRTVTLLFTDVTGSTAMGEQLDPEAYRGVMGRYFAVTRSAIERHGGTVEKFVGDAVLAVFGIPEIHEDDALRAVRAAQELNDAIVALSERLVAELGVRLAIRTGVNTGAVVAGSARAGGSFATGDAVNTAARLEQAATPGEILLGATTYVLVRDAVEAQPVAPVVARGKAEPVAAYRLLRVLDGARGRTGRHDVALIGRHRENDALNDAFARTVASGVATQVTVIGAAGMGKSRLVGDFLARLGDRATVAQGRCLSYGQGITYWPLVQALRDVLHLSGTESPEITRHAVAEALGGATDRDEVSESVTALLGKAALPGGSERTFWALRRLLEQLASQRPLVLSVDDLHWAEPDLLELLRRLAEELVDLPLLLLGQARPELLEQSPGWASQSARSTTVALAPLDQAETSACVAALLETQPPEGLAATVSDWSGGNPLFIEEIVTHMVESGVLEHDRQGRWQVARPLDRAEPPPTVTALLASRLDRLPPDERDLLERVSVIGLEFDTTQAEMVIEPPTAPALADLMASLSRRDLLRRVHPTGETWAFKHVLVRDAAYDGMAKAQRSELHERFADALAAGVEGGDERSGFVAHHLEQAARYRREVTGRDAETQTLVDRAVESLVLAADQARNREREDTSAAYLARALELRPSRARVRRDILTRRVVSCYEANLMDLLSEALEDLETQLDAEPDDVADAFLQTMKGVHELSTGGAADPERVSSSAQRLVDLGRRGHDVPTLIRGLRAMSVCSAQLARWEEAAAVSEEIIRIGSAADVRFARALHVVALTLGDGTLGEVRELIRAEHASEGHAPHQQQVSTLWDALVAAADCAPEAAGRIAAASARGEELYAAGVVREPTAPLLADAYTMNRDINGAIDYLHRVNQGFRRTGHLGYASTYIVMEALLMLERGDLDDAVVRLTEEAASYTSPSDVISLAYLAACRAILAARSGDLARSVGLAADSLSHADATDQLWNRADLRRSLSAVARAAGDVTLEGRLLREAAEMYARKEIRSYDAEIEARLAELDAAES
jgi:class 3 adenylate cyclase